MLFCIFIIRNLKYQYEIMHVAYYYPWSVDPLVVFEKTFYLIIYFKERNSKAYKIVVENNSSCRNYSIRLKFCTNVYIMQN